MILDCLKKIPLSKAKVLLCADTTEALSSLEVPTIDDSFDFRIVACKWNTLPDQQSIVDDVLRSLAEISLALWPSWYNQENLFHASAETSLEDKILNLIEIQHLRATQQELCLPWVKAAVTLCQAGKPPVVNHFSRVIQLSQLALAIQPENLFLLLCINDPDPQAYRRLGLAQAATWLAEATGTRVAVLMSEDLADHSELDSILYGALQIPQLTRLDEKIPEALESKLSIWPIRGKPHPFSPGEQKLAEKLADDPELGPFFHFNQSVRTVRDSLYLVDLLWRDGKVVVEVDGYRHHGNSFGFRADRHRDYELLISGYLVLRLPHDDVINDIEIAVEKIRDVVRFRRNQNEYLK